MVIAVLMAAAVLAISASRTNGALPQFIGNGRIRGKALAEVRKKTQAPPQLPTIRDMAIVADIPNVA